MADAATTNYELDTLERLTAIAVPEMAEDEWSRRRAAKLVGSISLESSVTVEQEPLDNHTDLLATIHEAAWGDAVARQRLTANVTTEMSEIAFKAGFVGAPVEFEIDESGQAAQYGQNTESITRNAWQYAAEHEIIKPRAEAETNNKFRVDDLYRRGLLAEHSFVVFSRCPTGKSKKELKDCSFFTETMSATIQVTGATETGLSLETAFVAGVTEPDGPRYDVDALIKLGHRLRVDYEGKSDSEIIDTPLLIHNKYLPNGVLDLVAWFDEETPDDTFFGQSFDHEPTMNDYQARRQRCLKQQDELRVRAQTALENLLQEADLLATPVEASERLHKLAEAEMVIETITNHTIQPSVFGPRAARDIEQARAYLHQGHLERIAPLISRAQATAQSSSCPSALKTKTATEGLTDLAGGSSSEQTAEEGAESNTGNIRCIKCREQVKKKDVVKKVSWCCPKCKYEVDICSGKVLHESQPTANSPQPTKETSGATLQKSTIGKKAA